MTNSIALDVVIGLVFIYLLYSLLASIVQEMIAIHLSFRAKVLEKGIVRMLQDEKDSHKLFIRIKSWLHFLFNVDLHDKGELTNSFYKHPLIKFLGEDKWYSKPSYLTAKNFSKVLIDLLRGTDLQVGNSFRTNIDNALNSGKITVGETVISIDQSTLSYLRSLWIDSQGDIDKFKNSIEQWYDDTMERATGWYKKYIQVVLFNVGLVIAITFNVDTIQIVQKLSKDPDLRAQLVGRADAYLKEHPTLKADMIAAQKRIEDDLSNRQKRTKDDSVLAKAEKDTLLRQYNEKVQRIDSLVTTANSLIKNDINNINGLIGLGWERKCNDKKQCPCDCPLRPRGWSGYSLIGWLLTALALSLGAPFWFDLLNKLMKLRGSVKTEETSANTISSPSKNINPKG